MKHLLPGSEDGWRVIQPYSEYALKINLGVLFGILTRLPIEASNYFHEAGIQEHYDRLSIVTSLYQDKGIVLFDLK